MQKIEKNNQIIAHNVVYAKKEKIYFVYVSKDNSNCEKNIYSLNDFKWHNLAVKKLSTSLRRITYKHHCNFYCLNYLHSFAKENQSKSHKNLCDNKDFCIIVIRSEDTKILECNQYQKSDKASFIIYPDLDCLIEKIDGCKNNPENKFKRKVGEHIPLGFNISCSINVKNIFS